MPAKHKLETQWATVSIKMVFVIILSVHGVLQ